MAAKLYQTCLRFVVIACCFLFGITPNYLFAETPIQALQETLHRFQQILDDSSLLEDGKKEQVLGTILARFDVLEMSKRMLGPYWEQHREQQDAFVEEFTEFMKRIFLNQFDQIKALKVSCRGEEIQGSTAKVVTNLSTSGEEFTINFRMHQYDSGWKIYDVMLDNGSFSLIKNYRAQLQSLLQFSSFEQMLHIIGRKNNR
jgi:ABC-type transporter MlaC component